MPGSPKQGILVGIILSVSKKLTQQQTELYTLAASLGADYRWLYDDSCTHLIHQVKIIFILLANKFATIQATISSYGYTSDVLVVMV